MKIIVAALTLILLLTACGDERPCLKYEEQTWLLPMYIGGMMVLIPQTDQVCVLHAEVQK